MKGRGRRARPRPSTPPRHPLVNPTDDLTFVAVPTMSERQPRHESRLGHRRRDQQIPGPHPPRRPGERRDAFHAWVTSPEGGGVPVERARLILSSQYPPDPMADAEPSISQIERRLNELIRIAEQSQRDGTGFRVGRRLYLYFSGTAAPPASRRPPS